ncbi:N-terminal glutamine amidase-domain-containing protein [Lipomyces oligophaga]|uniref:N-terminal glutamine amidase-domain-containing protein n=1 Tax=Lipomyces oligophaga TaxID=45792 RepID=UPI0034CDD8CA
MEMPYAACYCEENIYKAAEIMLQKREPEDSYNYFVVLMSNQNEKIVFWNQRASKSQDGFIIWDYHVILLRQEANGSTAVLDFDTSLNTAQESRTSNICTVDFIPFPEYIGMSLRPEIDLSPGYERRFRVVSASNYLEKFASDRSHMIVLEDGVEKYSACPPNWKPIQARNGSTMNLASFRVMDLGYDDFGQVLTQSEFINKFCRYSL